MNKKFFFVALLTISHLGFAHENRDPLPVGNFSVPTPTQISPLVSFGQLLIGKDALEPELGGSYTKAHSNFNNNLTPNIIYGILDELSATLFFPITLKAQSERSNSSGFGDLTLQLEYGFFSRSDINYAIQSTIVGNVQFPTGSIKKNPRTGGGTLSYFIGSTFSFLSPNWYAFASPGANFTISQNNLDIKFGNSFLYQCGIARNIAAFGSPGWIFDIMLEFDGVYTAKTKVSGRTDKDSGSNIILLTPSLWLSSNILIFQFGVSIPVLQQLNGIQEKWQYAINYNLGVGIQF